MKITMEFNLPDEETQFTCAVNGHKFRSVLWELDHHLRKTTKHGQSMINNCEANDIETQVAEHIRSYLHNYLLTEYNVTLEDI